MTAWQITGLCKRALSNFDIIISVKWQRHHTNILKCVMIEIVELSVRRKHKHFCPQVQRFVRNKAVALGFPTLESSGWTISCKIISFLGINLLCGHSTTWNKTVNVWREGESKK